MKSSEIFEAIYSALSAGLPSVTWQQPSQEKPSAAEWGVIQFEGEAPVSLSLPGYQYVYYKIWLYSAGTNGVDLINNATIVKSLLNNQYISTPAGKKLRFNHIGTSPLFFAEEYQCQAIDISFRTTTTSI